MFHTKPFETLPFKRSEYVCLFLKRFGLHPFLSTKPSRIDHGFPDSFPLSTLNSVASNYRQEAFATGQGLC